MYQELVWHVLATSSQPAERELFLEAWQRTHEAVQHLANVYQGELLGLQPAESRTFLAGPPGQQKIASQCGTEALKLVQGVVGYGLPLFRLAADLLAALDVSHPRATDELFRRFMFLTFCALRLKLFRVMSSEGWRQLAQAVEQATIARLQPIGLEQEEVVAG